MPIQFCLHWLSGCMVEKVFLHEESTPAESDAASSGAAGDFHGSRGQHCCSCIRCCFQVRRCIVQDRQSPAPYRQTLLVLTYVQIGSRHWEGLDDVECKSLTRPQVHHRSDAAISSLAHALPDSLIASRQKARASGHSDARSDKKTVTLEQSQRKVTKAVSSSASLHVSGCFCIAR